MLKGAESLRNSLAHSQNDLANGLDWKQNISLIEEMEKLVQQSDSLIEAKARKSTDCG